MTTVLLLKIVRNANLIALDLKTGGHALAQLALNHLAQLYAAIQR